MLTSILVFFIVLFACTLGAISGLGGGIIIKPLMDALGGFSAASVNAMASITILTMTIVSIIKSRRNALGINWRVVIFFTIGSMIGGVLGNRGLALLIEKVANDDFITIIQSLLQIIIVILVIIHELLGNKIPHYHLENRFVMCLIGVGLGVIAAFLSIGGGIFNRPLLIILLSLSHRNAVFASLCIIFFAQTADVITMGVMTHFLNVNSSIILVMGVAAILGGYIGGCILSFVKDKYLNKIFVFTLIFILAINSLNMISHMVRL